MEPRPLTPPTPVRGYSWPAVARSRCPPIVAPAASEFADAFALRRSLRRLGRASLREVVNCVAFATRPRVTYVVEGIPRSSRPAPSSGALHAVQLVIVDFEGCGRICHYDPVNHELTLLRKAPGQIEKLRASITQLLPEANATAIVLVGDTETHSAVYQHGTSLLWRDAGVLLMTLAFAAHGFRLGFCPLGIEGNEFVSGFGVGHLKGLGGAVIGRTA